MSDSQHTHEDTTHFHEDCPLCRRQRYGNAERTTTEPTEVAQTMTTEAALSVPEDGGEGGDDSA